MGSDREEDTSHQEIVMSEEREPKEDGRYIIFYWFEPGDGAED